jgi:DNA-binding transcriptional MerR regulator
VTRDLQSFDLSELSDAAGVTPRTVRYYVQQGLLPSPGTRGPGTRYDRSHLERLQLIRRLQREHLPLAEIRRRLEELNDQGIREVLAASAEQTSTESSALDYVRDLLGRQSMRMAAEPHAVAAPLSAAHEQPPPPSGPAQGTGSVFGAVFGRMRHQQSAAEPTPPIQSGRSTRSTWERISLAPDVELHVRRPLSREQNRQVERLLEAARDLFAEEP